jgi:hypothetical protein
MTISRTAISRPAIDSKIAAPVEADAVVATGGYFSGWQFWFYFKTSKRTV